MFFSDLHIELLSRGILNPGERLLGQTVTSYAPWWACGLIRRQYLVLATDQRLILVDHRYGLLRPTVQRLHGVDSLPWSNVQELKITGIFRTKKLKVRGASERGPIALKMEIGNLLFGLLAPMKDNMKGARNLAAVALQSMQGAGAPALGPAPQQFGAPPISYQAPAPQLQAPYSQAPAQQHAQPYSQPPMQAMPQINAPGYNSVPPPPAMPYGVAPVPSPFDPPRHY